MIFHETALAGAYLIDIEKREDERGFFARTWCEEEFRQHGLVARVAQANTSYNVKAGTLRGMHYQLAPYQEAKLVRCTQGALYDVIVDLRRDSVTYKRWIGVELTASNSRMVYVPPDFAHGFITLEDNTEAIYLISEFYVSDAQAGLRWNDPKLKIEWPRAVEIISERDASWPDFTD